MADNPLKGAAEQKQRTGSHSAAASDAADAAAGYDDEETVRFNVNVPAGLHEAFKRATKRKGTWMKTATIQFMKEYVRENG